MATDRALRLVVVLGAILIGFPAHADVFTRASACPPAAIGGIGCINEDVTAPTGDVTATNSGTRPNGQTFSGTASAFVDATDLVKLRVSGAVVISGFAQAGGASTIVIDDVLTLSDPVLNGRAGTIAVPVSISGTTATTNNAPNAFGGQATASWTYFVVQNGTNELFNAQHRFTQLDHNSNSVVLQ